MIKYSAQPRRQGEVITMYPIQNTSRCPWHMLYTSSLRLKCHDKFECMCIVCVFPFRPLFTTGTGNFAKYWEAFLSQSLSLDRTSSAKLVFQFLDSVHGILIASEYALRCQDSPSRTI